MFKPLPLFLGLRYMRAKKRNHFISFIALTSMLGIALGVTVLITVLSVMNGFDQEIKKRFFGMAPEVTVTRLDGEFSNWQSIRAKLKSIPAVRGIAPFSGGEGLLTANGSNVPLYLSGILPEEEKNVSTLNQSLLSGELAKLRAAEFGILIGKTLADQLGLQIGDTVTALIPKANFSPFGLSPRFKTFKVVGIFSVGSGFGFDDKLAFIHLRDAQALFMQGNAITGLHLKIQNVYDAPKIAEFIKKRLSAEYQINNWTEQFGAFFKAVRMEKNMMFIILLLIIAVAAFNLVSSLVMIVNEKQSDIAIMRTYGVLPKTIMAIFMVQGLLVGLIGTGLGLIGGILLALNVTTLTNALQHFFGIQLLSSNVYFVDYLPSQLQFADLWHITLVAILMSFIATLYPAWHASKTQPAEALRYD